MDTPVKNTNKSEWLTPTDKRIIKTAGYVGGGLIVGSILFLIGRHVYRKKSAGNAETKTLNDGAPENYANRIILAFHNDGWWGTNIKELRTVFTEIPDQQTFFKMVDKYEALTKQPKGAFYKDLTKNLTSSEYYEMQSILKGKPMKPGEKAVFNWNVAYSVSHRLKAAFDYTVWGVASSDKGALETALRDIPSLYAYAMVRVAYKKEYGHELEDVLSSKLGVFDFSWKDIVYAKPVK
jgi:hypothetical protein